MYVLEPVWLRVACVLCGVFCEANRYEGILRIGGCSVRR